MIGIKSVMKDVERRLRCDTLYVFAWFGLRLMYILLPFLA
jgi:hypothetical protein